MKLPDALFAPQVTTAAGSFVVISEVKIKVFFWKLNILKMRISFIQ